MNEAKKSLIPQSATTPFPFSSSTERDGLKTVTLGFSRSTSVEHAAGEDCPPPSDLQASNNENLFTPMFEGERHAKPARKIAVSVQRTARKDTRPLTDKSFQSIQLAKVQKFLLAHKIITSSEVQKVQNPMTLKLFVRIMNSFLMELFPEHSLTISNYCELIPLLMRKLKYPGNLVRSWLVTANSPHTWPNVLGLLSWLTDLVNSQTSNYSFVEENMMDTDRVNKFFVYTREAYVKWDENGTTIESEEDSQFCENLVLDQKELLCEQLEKAEKEVEAFQDLATNRNTPKEQFKVQAAEEKFKAVKLELEERKMTRNSQKEKLVDMRCRLESNKNEIEKLLSEKDLIEKNIADITIPNPCIIEDLAKLQSEVVSLRNVIRLQNGHITDIDNQCYESHLTNARLQGKFDEVRLKQEALLLGSTSEYIDASKFCLVLNYGNEDNSKIVTEYITHVKETRHLLENLVKEFMEKTESYKMQMNEEEKLELCKGETCRIEAELKQLDKERADKYGKYTAIQSGLRSMNEELLKMQIKHTTLEQTVQMEWAHFCDLEEELRLLEESFAERKAKCTRILQRMGDELCNHVKRCVESMRLE